MKTNPIQSIALAVAIAVGLAASSAQALTTTMTFNLGTSPVGTNFPVTGENSLIVWIPKGSLPPGSILRSVTATNLKLETLNGSWASDLGVFVDPTPETPGGDGLLKIGADNNYGGSVNSMDWGGGNGDGPYASLSRTEADWTPANIDLHDAAVMLGNGWADDTTYSGTITVEYDVTALTVALTSPAAAQAFETGTSVTASAIVVEPGAFTDTVTFHTTPISPLGSTVPTVSSSTTTPFTADLGALPAGTYEIYATVVNNDSPPGTATSATHTFTVEAAVPTTTVLAPSGPATTYGENVTFTATVSPTPTGGTVQFYYDGGSYLGAPVPVNTTTGVATYSTTALAVGTHEITAEYSGYQIYQTSTTAAFISQEVNKAQLTVKALNMQRAPNTANPDPLLYQITGFQNGQNLASSGVTGTPALSTDAILTSPAGNYVITCAAGSLAASNYSFALVNGTLTVAVVADTFSVNFYAYPGWMTSEELQATQRVPDGVPAGMGGWFTSGWTNVSVPWGGGLQPDQTLTSNNGSSATFIFKDCRNGWTYGSSPRTTLLGDGNGNMMDSQVNSTLDGESNKFDMEMTGIPFATYDVIFYMGGTEAQYGDGTGVIKFNGGAERAYLMQPGGFTGTFTEMVDATTPGNYIVFTGVTGSSFTCQTWGTGPGDFNHNGPTGFQIREATVATGYTAWANANNASGQTADQDHDNDGVENGIEYFMGQTGSSFTVMPGLDGSNTVTWPMILAYNGTYEVQTSPNLSTWTNVVPRPTPSGGSLSYLLPPGLGSQFVRLLVTPTP